MTNIIDAIDRISDDVLIHVIQHSNDFSWKFLAVKISLTRLNLKIQMFPENGGIQSLCCTELRNLLRKSINVPNALEDIKLLISLQAELKLN